MLVRVILADEAKQSPNGVATTTEGPDWWAADLRTVIQASMFLALVASPNPSIPEPLYTHG